MNPRFLRSFAVAALPAVLAVAGCGQPMENDAPIIDSVEAPLQVREYEGTYTIPIALLFHDNDIEAVTHVRYRFPPNIDGMIGVPAANPTKESARLTIVINAADLDGDDGKGGTVPGLTSNGEKREDDAKRQSEGGTRTRGRGKRTLELSIIDGRGAESRPQSSVVTLD